MTDGLLLESVSVSVGELRIVDDVALAVPAGAVVAVVGPAGSGRSTLLRVLAGARSPDRGRVLLNGSPVDPAAVGFASQEHLLLGGLTSVENVTTRLMAMGRRRGPGWSGVPELLSRLGLPESSWHNLTEQLSGGQQQRVAVARALVGSPALVCLDEPTSELDESSAALVWDRVAAVAAAGTTVVVVSNDLPPGLPVHATIETGSRARS